MYDELEGSYFVEREQGDEQRAWEESVSRGEIDESSKLQPEERSSHRPRVYDHRDELADSDSLSPLWCKAIALGDLAAT